MNFVAKAAAVAGLLLSVTLPAQADVIFNFNQVGPFQGEPDPGLTIPDLHFDGNLIVTDAAARDGFAYTLRNNGTSPYQVSALTGLVGLSVSTEDPAVGFQLPQLLRPVRPGNASPDGFYSFNLSGSLATGLFGRLDYNDTGAEIGLTFAGTTFTGTFGADFQQGCTSPLCTYSGNISTVAVPVPEPASLALFGMGLAGLGLIRRKRAA